MYKAIEKTSDHTYVKDLNKEAKTDFLLLNRQYMTFDHDQF